MHGLIFNLQHLIAAPWPLDQLVAVRAVPATVLSSPLLSLLEIFVLRAWAGAVALLLAAGASPFAALWAVGQLIILSDIPFWYKGRAPRNMAVCCHSWGPLQSLLLIFLDQARGEEMLDGVQFDLLATLCRKGGAHFRAIGEQPLYTALAYAMAA